MPFVRPEAMLFNEVFVPVAKGVRVGKLKADTVHVDALKVAHLVSARRLSPETGRTSLTSTLDKYEFPSSCHRPKLSRSGASQRDRQDTCLPPSTVNLSTSVAESKWLPHTNRNPSPNVAQHTSESSRCCSTRIENKRENNLHQCPHNGNLCAISMLTVDHLTVEDTVVLPVFLRLRAGA